MSDTEGSKAKFRWTDRSRLAYFFSLVDYSKAKLDYVNAPRPEGISVGAARIMVQRLKATLKDDLEALRSGAPMSEDSPKKKPATPRKRKAKDGEDGKDTPTKRPRKKKTAVSEELLVDEPVDDEEMFKVKDELFDDQV